MVCYLAPQDRKFAPGAITVSEIDGSGINRSCRMNVDKVLVGTSNNEQPYQRLCVSAHAETGTGAPGLEGDGHETCEVTAQIVKYADAEQLSDWDVIPRLKLERSDIYLHPEQSPSTSIPRSAGSSCSAGYHPALGTTCVADYCPPGTAPMDGACRTPAHTGLLRPESIEPADNRRPDQPAR